MSMHTKEYADTVYDRNRIANDSPYWKLQFCEVRLWLSRARVAVERVSTLGVQTFTKVSVYTNFSKEIRATTTFPNSWLNKKTRNFEINVVFSFSVSKVWGRLRSLFKAQSSHKSAQCVSVPGPCYQWGAMKTPKEKFWTKTFRLLCAQTLSWLGAHLNTGNVSSIINGVFGVCLCLTVSLG